MKNKWDVYDPDEFYDCEACGSRVTLGGSDVQGLLERIGKLQTKLAELETQLAEAQKKASVHDWVLKRLVRMGAVL